MGSSDLSGGGPLQVSSQRLSEGVYDRLVTDIRTGVLRPGDPLRDRDVAERLGVSRTPVREAIQRLERAGLLDVWPGRQTKVRELSDDDTTRLYEYFGELCAMHVRFGMGSGDDPNKDGEPVYEAARALAGADEETWAGSFVGFMEKVAAYEVSVRGRLLEDHLPLMSIVLRRPPEIAGDRLRLSADLNSAIERGDIDAATDAIRALFGLDG
ncbi:GntR family transcriptional regulator [Microbacterium halotolerans]|uniref:GntR family transcriptional regulator n=1 Tax=Microbacterium halotolerans TaxID=246613 RepID=UPI000E6AB8D1|nr:GntR family transcriptional regulator [Microbacterium halotolerans]